MQTESYNQRLDAKRGELAEWRDRIVTTAMLCGFLFFPLLVITPVLILAPVLEPLAGPVETWFDFNGNAIGSSFGVILTLVLIVFTVAGPLWLAPMLINSYWKRHYSWIFSKLRDSTLPLLIMDDAALTPLWSALAEPPLLRLTATQRPKSLDQRIELASDYWRALSVIASSRHAGLKRAIFWGNATRMIDDVSPLIYNACVSTIVIAVLAPLFFFFMPLWIGVLVLTIQQQSAQAAMVDFFLNEAPSPLIDSGVE